MDESDQTSEPVPRGVDPQRRWTLFPFLRTVIGFLDIWWATVPITFIALKYAGIALVSVATADTILEHLGPYWPVLSEQYAKIAEVASDAERRNFGPFVVAGLLFGLIPIFRAVSQYFRNRARVEANGRDLFFACVISLAAYALSWLDHVNAKPRLGWDFYIDSFGLYYFRQTLIPYATSYVVLIWIILAAEFIKNIPGILEDIDN